ncbi:MAG: glycosyltransferase [Planctomycetota bacterium]|nr:glycosyltransferase [Planctomycetota bacterium]
MNAPGNEADRERRASAKQDLIDVTLVIPVTMADAPVAEVVGALGAELNALSLEWEACLVFDGVRGPAWEAAQALAAENDDDPEATGGGRVLTIALNQQFGESACLAAAFEQSRGRVIVTSPAYVQIDPREVAVLLEQIDAGADLVTPWRHPRVDPAWNRLQSDAFNWVMRRIIQMEFHDLNCYFRAIHRGVLEDLAIYGDMYRFLPVIAHRQGYKVAEVKVRHLREWGGEKFYGVGIYSRRLLDILGVVFLTRFTHKPLRFFGSLGGIFSLLGGLMVGGLVIESLLVPEAGLYQRPLFLLGLMLLVLGVQIIGFGLVGEIIIFTQARHLREYRIERIYE